MTCADCIHYIFGGARCRCDVRPAHAPGFLNKACDKFEAGDSRKDRADYLKDMPEIKINKIRKQRVYMNDKSTTTPAPVKASAPGMKVCKRCGRELPLEMFPHSHLSKDGYQTICRDCISESIKEAHATGRHPGRKGRKADEPEPAKMISDTVKSIAEKDTSIRLDYPQSILGTIRDTDLVAELRRRGWEVKATKTATRFASSFYRRRTRPMDKRAALKAAVAVVAFLIPILILAGLVYLAFHGRIWADVVLAVIFAGLAGYGFYDVLKD